VLVKIFVNSGMTAPAIVPQLMIIERIHQRSPKSVVVCRPSNAVPGIEPAAVCIVAGAAPVIVVTVSVRLLSRR